MSWWRRLLRRDRTEEPETKPARRASMDALPEADRIEVTDDPSTRDITEAEAITINATDRAIEAADKQLAGLEARALADEQFRRAVPRGMQIASSWAWRFLIIAAAMALLGWLVVELSVITIPLAVAILLAAGLSPIKNQLQKWGIPSAGAAAICVIGGVVVVFGALGLIIAQVVDQSDELFANAVAGIEQFTTWLNNRNFLTVEQVQDWQSQALTWIADWAQRSQALIAQYSIQAGSLVGNFLAGMAMALFALFFLLHDGRAMWRFGLRLVPRAGRAAADRAGLAGWKALVAYVKATVTVAAVDAVFPLIAGLILGVDLAWAMAGLIFLGAFIPIVGVVVTGAVAIFVTLVTVGWVQAIVMFAVIVAVNQLEGNILQPMLLGRAVALHPLAVLFSIAVGISIAGIIGGLLVVPILAFTKAAIDVFANEEPGTLPAPSNGR